MKFLTVGNQFKSTEGVFTIKKIMRKNCIVEWSNLQGKLWTLASSEILDLTKATYVSVKKTKPSKYPASIISSRPSKLTANEIFIRAISCKGGRVAYLDAEDANTTTLLQKLCPNMFRVAINYDTEVCQKILKIANENLTIFRGKMGMFVKQQPSNSLHVWFDYCGTVSGNKTMKPLEDIQMAIDRKIFLYNGGIAAFTFCMRDRQRQNDIEIHIEVFNMFKKNYPKSKIIHIFRYYPSMLFFLIRV